MRARYSPRSAGPSAADVEADLRARDARARRGGRGRRAVVLWFEHDLYDQLQLLQILAGLPDRPVRRRADLRRLVPRASGLRRPRRARARGAREPVAGAHAGDPRARARRARRWDASAAPTRARSRALAATPDERLPFLAPALRRLLEELPGARDGLARTRAPAAGRGRGGRAHARAGLRRGAAREEAPFLGDTIAFDRLDELRAGAAARHGGGGLALTAAGADVLAGRADRVALIGFDRWLGGMHLRAGDGLWRWDAERGALVAPDALASRACPTPPPLRAALDRSAPRAPLHASLSGTAPRSPPPGPTAPPSPPARRRRSRTSCARPASSGSAAPTSPARSTSTTSTPSSRCSTTGSRRRSTAAHKARAARRRGARHAARCARRAPPAAELTPARAPPLARARRARGAPPLRRPDRVLPALPRRRR